MTIFGCVPVQARFWKAGRRSRDSRADPWRVSKGGLSRYGPAHVPRLLSECAFFPKEGQAPRGGAPCVVVHLEEA